MQVAFASAPNPGRENEDFVAASSNVVVVLDGAGLPDGLNTGCVHGVPWFVQQLGAELLSRAADRTMSLADCLADAIERTAQLHGHGCDLSNPLTPTSTVAMVRAHDERVEWLALADSTVVINGRSGIQAVSDHRVNEVTSRQRFDLATTLHGMEPGAKAHILANAQRAVMNTAGGYWVAATEPKAASEALVGSASLADVCSAALLTDGAARAVDDFQVMTWRDALDHLEGEGPQGLINRTRALEVSDPDHERWARNKRHDDATAALLRF